MREFDYIVCGAGTSGCVVAARLAANPQIRVLLLEAGGNDESELIGDPNRWPMTLGSQFDWGPTEQQDFLRNGLGTFWHQCGTARMGQDSMSVVDGELKVHGVDGLRIADASILPRVTSGNTMAPCVVIGEQAARFLEAA